MRALLRPCARLRSPPQAPRLPPLRPGAGHAPWLHGSHRHVPGLRTLRHRHPQHPRALRHPPPGPRAGSLRSPGHSRRAGRLQSPSIRRLLRRRLDRRGRGRLFPACQPGCRSQGGRGGEGRHPLDPGHFAIPLEAGQDRPSGSPLRLRLRPQRPEGIPRAQPQAGSGSWCCGDHARLP